MAIWYIFLKTWRCVEHRLREIIKAEKELLLFIYDEHTDLTEEYIRNYWQEYFEAYCHVLEQNNGRESNE